MTLFGFWAFFAVVLAVGIAIGMAIGRFRAVHTAAQRGATRAMVLQHELRRAMDHGELVLHYQPKIELSTGRVSCLEALVRWQHPERGLLTPSEFVPAAEQQSALIGSLTSWVLRQALNDYINWTASGHHWTVAVNISAHDLESSQFADTVAQILHETGVPPDRLQLEVTETALAGAERGGRVVDALAAQGVVVSIDDFGTGFISESQLRTLKVAEVKIAKTFVAALPGDRATVRALIDRGSSLGCLVTAVGVEWQEVADWLLDAGCDHAQGYLWLRGRAWTEVAEVFGPGGRTRVR